MRKRIVGFAVVSASIVISSVFCADEPEVEAVPLIPISTVSSDETNRTGEYGSWLDSYAEVEFGEGDKHPDISKQAAVWTSENEVEIITTIPFVEYNAELVFADESGAFSGSWCEGSVRFASIVLPESDGEGRLLDRWKVPLHGLDGELLVGTERDECLDLLRRFSLFTADGEGPSRANFREQVLTTSVMALLEISKAETDWEEESFQCFQRGNWVYSHCARGERNGSAILGDAELFFWHKSPVRLHWDLYGKGERTTEPISPEVGEEFRSGGTALRVIAVEPGIFVSTDVDEVKGKRTKISYRRKKDSNGWTCFLAGNQAGSKVRRVEMLGSDGEWRETAAACEDFGVIVVDLPSAESREELPEIRIVWTPKRLRVVADIPAIGGGLSENDGISTYNEIVMEFHGQPIWPSKIPWNLANLLGFRIDHGEHWDSQNRDASVSTEPGKTYRIADIVAMWNASNPGFVLRLDAEEKTIRIEKDG